MEPVGILLYGYSNDESVVIQDLIEKAVNNKIVIISGSQKENSKVIDILEQGPTDDFEDKDNKILVFLGFSENQLENVLNLFPKNGEIKRPIFCGLTEQNINWTLDYLIEHLVEEDRYWSNKKKQEE